MNADAGAARPSYFSMLRLSGIHLPNRHRVHMAFAAYYDGSGKADQPCTTLTGVAATESLWPDFERLWVEALDWNKVPERDFHMTDLMSRNGKFRGWNHTARSRLIKDLFNVLGQFRSSGLSAYSCTVFYDAHRKAKSMLPRLRKPEAICVDYCVGGLQLTEEQLDSEPRPILLYFDRKEGFLHTVNKNWLRCKKNKTGWPSQVRNIIPADRSEHYPIQAADMLAWTVNRCRRTASERGEPQPRHHWQFCEELDEHNLLYLSSWILVNHYMEFYDNDEHLINRYPDG